jgi:hypothetical protein
MKIIFYFPGNSPLDIPAGVKVGYKTAQRVYWWEEHSVKCATHLGNVTIYTQLPDEIKEPKAGGRYVIVRPDSVSIARLNFVCPDNIQVGQTWYSTQLTKLYKPMAWEKT